MSALMSFADALVTPQRPVPSGVTDDALRFAVYRNTVHVSLVEALAKGFPVVRQLVGEAFFAAMAREFVGHEKPQSPVLSEYGAGFSGFVAAFPPAAALPYLADVALLEWEWRRAYHAADRAALTASALAAHDPATLATQRFARHPAARIVSSRYPIGSLWAANQASPPTPLARTAAETVLVTRPRLEVRLTILPQQDGAFANALIAGETLAEAVGRVTDAEGFDPGRALVGLVTAGAFSADSTTGEHS